MGKKITLSENDLRNIVKQSIMEYFYFDSKNRKDLYESRLRQTIRKAVMESLYNNMDGFTSNSTMDVNNANVDDYDEDKEREMEIGRRIVDLEDFYPDTVCRSNSAYGVELIDDGGDRYGEPNFPYKPYLGLFVQGEHESNLGEVFIEYGDNFENSKTIIWKDMTDRMKDEVEQLVNMAWESGREEFDS